MLNVSYHCGGTVAGVNIVLLDTGITSNGEEGGSRAVIADGSDAISCRHGFIGHSLGADIPRAGLTFGVLYDPTILRPCKPTGAGFSLFLLVKNTNHARGIAAMLGLWHAPYPEVTV